MFKMLLDHSQRMFDDQCTISFRSVTPPAKYLLQYSNKKVTSSGEVGESQ